MIYVVNLSSRRLLFLKRTTWLLSNSWKLSARDWSST